MKIGVAIDSWKLPIFKKYLTKFTYEVLPGITEDTLSLIVITDNKEGLLKEVTAANIECAEHRINRN